MDNEKQICRYCKYWVEEIFGTSKCSHGEAIIQNRGFCEQKLYVSKDMYKDENPKSECSCWKFERETSWE